MTTLQEKLDSGMALNVGELVKARGYGRRALKRMAVPLVEGKITAAAFDAHVEKLRNEGYARLAATVVGASPAPSSDLRSVAGKMRGTHKLNGRRVSSHLLSESRLHNSALLASP